MPQSPVTPTRRRRSSAYSISHSASSSFMNSSGRPPHSRKSSMQSLNSPATPFTPSALDRHPEFGYPNENLNMGSAVNGLGSLADELAEEEWDEDEELLEEEEDDPSGTNGMSNNLNGRAGNMGGSPNYSPRSPTSKRRRNRRRSTRSNLSGFSNESDDIDESQIISLELEQQIAEIKRLSKQDFSPQSDKSQDIFLRVESQLKDLGSQATMESHTTRLSNSLISLTTHLTTQTRVLSTLTQPYTSPLSVPPPPELASELLNLLTSLSSLLPQSPSTPLPSLTALQSTCDDLITSLSLLNESIFMGRQTTTLAARRLKSAREMVGILQRETREAEEGLRWLAAGGWEEKLKQREAARICGEVVGGFEEVCEGWRRRLFEGAAVAA
ncbi:hypothetical protein MMC10_008293 [Thelotrema lepadinum]|nr:hypothetical protein [Thelotrema lepadinum]